MKYRVWDCQIIVPAEEVAGKDGFDLPPRMAAQRAIESHGVKILVCSSGWRSATPEEEQRLAK